MKYSKIYDNPEFFFQIPFNFPTIPKVLAALGTPETKSEKKNMITHF